MNLAGLSTINIRGYSLCTDVYQSLKKNGSSMGHHYLKIKNECMILNNLNRIIVPKLVVDQSLPVMGAFKRP